MLCFNETIKEGIDAATLHNQFTPFETQFEESIPQVFTLVISKQYFLNG